MTHPTRRQFLARAAGTAGAAAALAEGGLPAPLLSQVPRPRRFDLVVRGGTVVDPAQGITGVRDVAITGGRIERVAESIPEAGGGGVVDARGKIVTPGLIDVHVHVYEGVASVGIEADLVGVTRGVTSLIDGGSAGATTFPGFRAYVAEPARTRVYALLNIARPGMTVGNETADLSMLDPEAAADTIRAHRDVVVGLKVRMLAGIPEGQDLEVMRRTRTAADLAGVPIMVHIGGQTSPLPAILDLLRPGDVVTHALRQRGSILDANGRVYPEVRDAVAAGIFLDVGHGRGNLDFDVAESVLQQGVLPSLISSDVHRGNALGPVFDLPTTLSKFMQMGMTLEQVVERATSVPARVFDLGERLGTLAEGAAADLALFDLAEGEVELTDSGGKRRTGSLRLVPWGALRDGRAFGSITI